MGRKHQFAAVILLVASAGCASDATRRFDAIDARLAAIEAKLTPPPPASLGELAESARFTRARRDLIVTNLANVETIAFKRLEIREGDVVRIDMSQGRMENTDRQLDVAINGTGLFRVKTSDGVAYTRNGNFFRNDAGELVLGSKEGHRITPTITLPEGTVDVNIGEDGIVEVVAKDNQVTRAGQIELVRFTDAERLTTRGAQLFIESTASGPPIAGRPNEGGFGSLMQSFLEASNVEPNAERARLGDVERTLDSSERTLARYDAPRTSPVRPAR